MAEQRSTIVTGSTSGIGLAIATALAGAGCNVMVNGFGDAAEIEKIRAGLAAGAKGKIVYLGGYWS